MLYVSFYLLPLSPFRIVKTFVSLFRSRRILIRSFFGSGSLSAVILTKMPIFRKRQLSWLTSYHEGHFVLILYCLFSFNTLLRYRYIMIYEILTGEVFPFPSEQDEECTGIDKSMNLALASFMKSYKA